MQTTKEILSSASLLLSAGKLEDADRACRLVLQDDPHNADAHNELGNIARALGHMEQAVVHYRRAIKRRPDAFGWYSNLASTLGDLRRDDEARECFSRSLALAPDSAQSHFNHAIWLLRRGDWQEGWREFEWRLKTPGWNLQNLRQPQWRGEPIAGKTILIYGELGLGDTIMFARFAKVLQQMGARVILGAQQPLVHVLHSCPGIAQLVSTHAPAFDYHCPLVSVPAALNLTIDAIPADIPYILPDRDAVARWRDQLGKGFKVGIAWQGNPNYAGDRRRSIPLQEFAPLSLPGVRLISLQKGFGTEQIAGADFPIEQLGDFDSVPFVDTAGVMANLDLVVTSDTAVAHLAGALGVKVWLALDSRPEWRWMWDRSDSPWYPTMRLFRQKKAGDWAGVFNDVLAELRSLASIS